MKNNFGKLDYFYAKKGSDLFSKIKEIGLRSYIRNSIFDKNDPKLLVKESDINKYGSILKELHDLVVDGDDFCKLLNNRVQYYVRTIKALRDQYNPPYDCSWFVNYKTGFNKVNKNSKCFKLLVNLLGTSREDKLCNIYAKRDRFGNLIISFGIRMTPKTIGLSLPGIIDISEGLFDEEKYCDISEVEDYIPKFSIYVDLGLGGKPFTVSNDITKYKEFTEDLIKIFDQDVNSHIPEKPELRKSMSYEEFCDWKLNRIANNNINENS